MSLDIELMADTVEKMSDRMLEELVSLTRSHGPQFAASTMLSVCANISGASLALSKDTETQQAGICIHNIAMVKACEHYSAQYATNEAIDKAKQ